VAGFASNEAVMGRWRATLGLRIDHQTLIGNDFTVSPRVSVVFSPTPAHQLRIAFNKGYNNPSLIQNFAKFSLNGAALSGNRNLDPERIDYGEVAYGGTIARWLRLFANAFIYRMTGSITLDQTYQWQNSPSAADAYGGETGFEVAPNRALSGYAHYAYIHLSGGPYSMSEPTPPANLGSPVNKVTAGIRLNMPMRIYLTADGQYFGSTEVARLNDSGMSTMPPPAMPPTYWTTAIPAYVMLDARAGIVFDNGLDFSIAGTNILNQTEAELLGAQNPRLRVMAAVAYTP
jgi:outer membrane receptor protein involved in Fe transport